jgi:preprotein translocase subunit SecA
MIDTIRQEIASRLHLVRIQTAGDREGRVRSPAASLSASHGSVGAFAGGSVSAGPGSAGASGDHARRAGPAAQSQPEAATVVRAYPKVGRNDLCPGGSGKKYKFCHGR